MQQNPIRRAFGDSLETATLRIAIAFAALAAVIATVTWLIIP